MGLRVKWMLTAAVLLTAMLAAAWGVGLVWSRQEAPDAVPGWVWMAALAALWLLCMAVAVAALQQWVLRPMRQLEQACHQLQAGDASARVSANGRDEWSALFQAFNRAAERLASSEQKFRTIFDAFPHPISLNRVADGTYVDVNPAFEASNGCTRDQLIGMSSADSRSAQEREYADQARARLLATGRLDAESTRVLAPDGSERWILYASRLIQIGGESMALSVVTDVTELKKTELALRVSQANLSALFEHAPVPMSYSPVVPGEGKSYWNRAWYACFGHPQGSREGQSGSEFGFWCEESRHRLFVEQLTKEGHVSGFEAPLRRADGGVRLCAVYGTVSVTSHRLALISYLDVTEQRMQEMRMREFGVMVESATDGIFFVDAGCIYQANAAAEAMFGADQGALNGRTPAQLSPAYQPDGRTSQDAAAQRLAYAAAGHSERFFWQHQRMDGTTFMAQVVINGVKGYADRVVAVLRDVTEEQAAARALKHSEARYRRLLDSMLEGFAVTDLAGRFTYFNETFRQMLGYSAEVLKTLTYEALTPLRWHAAERDILSQQVLVKGYSEIYEKQYRSAQGVVFPVELRTYLDCDEHGQPIGYWALVRDITERKQAEEKKWIESSEKRLQAVLKATGEGAWDWDLATASLYHSPRWCEILGFDPAQSNHDIGVFMAQVHAEDRARVADLIDHALHPTGGSYQSQHRMQRLDGTLIWVQDRGAVIERGVDGRPLRMVGSVSDITAQKTAELALLQAKAETESTNVELATTLERLRCTQDDLIRSEKLAALGSLVAGVAHELNTPIGNAVTVATTVQDAHKALMARMDHGLTRANLNTFLDMVGEAGAMLTRNLHRAADLVSNFRQLAVDQSSYQRRQFRLSDAVDEVRVVMMPAVRKAKATLQCDIPEDIRLDSYPGPLTQGLMILVSNSLVHGFSNGRPGLIAIAAQPLGADQVCLTVQDDGSGIPAKNLDRIFEPFFTTRLGQGGSGLGLHILFNIVTGVLGGRITAHSEPGRGTRFVITLPVVAAVASPDSLRGLSA